LAGAIEQFETPDRFPGKLAKAQEIIATVESHLRLPGLSLGNGEGSDTVNADLRERKISHRNIIGIALVVDAPVSGPATPCPETIEQLGGTLIIGK